MANKVTYILELRDKYSQYARKIQQSSAKMVSQFETVKIKSMYLNDKLRKLAKTVNHVGQSMRNAGGNITMGFSAGAAVIGGFALKTTAQFEQMAIGITTLAGSASAGSKLMTDLKTFAATTPFEMKGLAKGAQTLIGMGEVLPNKIIPTMRKLGDLASGTGADIQSLAYEFSQIKSKGKADSIDLKQLALRGFNVLKVLQQMAKEQGHVFSMTDMQKFASEGQISFELVSAALDKVTGKGGRFNGMMAAQSKTLAGLWSNFTDEVDFAADSIGATLVELFDLKQVLKDLSIWVSNFAKKFNSFAKEHPTITKFVLGFVAFLAVVGPLLIVFGAMASGMSAMIALAPILGTALTFAFGPIGLAVAAISLAIVGLITYWDEIMAKIHEGVTFMAGVLGIDDEGATGSGGRSGKAQRMAASSESAATGQAMNDQLEVVVKTDEGTTASVKQRSSGGRSRRKLKTGINNAAAM